jgi:hypothetical protein
MPRLVLNSWAEHVGAQFILPLWSPKELGLQVGLGKVNFESFSVDKGCGHIYCTDILICMSIAQRHLSHPDFSF